MGEVFRAYDRSRARPVALKQIRPETAADPRHRRRFRREARLAARLHHPGIVRVYEVFQAEGCDWIVMELVDGRPLSEILPRQGLEVARAVELAVEITSALAEAHRLGILHRDLKAENVLVTSEGRTRILDFGLAKEVFGPESTGSLTTDGQVMGTPHAMSPEQAMGRKVDLRSDLFSLGTLIYRMVTGRFPFAGTDALTTLNRICLSHPPPLRELAPRSPSALCDLVDRLLEKDPDLRPPSAAEVLDALARIGMAGGRPAEGHPAEGRPPLPPPATPAGGAPQAETLDSFETPRAERRQLTVLACELVGAGAADGSLDPEQLFPVMDGFEEITRRVVESAGGRVAHLLGHQMVAHFGAHTIREDDAARAVLAALELIERCRLGPDLAARAVVHTGPAVVSASSRAALAGTLDHAVALLRTARPSQLLASRATHRLLAGRFDVKRLGAMALGGLVRPLEVVQILGETSVDESWRDVEGQPPMIGRRAELKTLLARWRRAVGGQGSAVLVAGEAGVGKSRLLTALATRVESMPPDGAAPRLLAVHGRSHASHAPFHAVSRWILDLLDLEDASAGEQLFAALRSQGLDTRRAGVLAGLFGFDGGPADAAADATADETAEGARRQREERLAALVELLRCAARRRPVLLLVEDLQWLDDSSVELLGRWIAAVADLPVLLVAAHRPGFEPPWDTTESWQCLSLGRLEGDAAERLLDRLLPAEALPENLRRRLLDKADGVPLFVEELAAAWLESGISPSDRGDPSAGELSLPGSLLQLLAARLDRLGAARATAQVAAVIGRQAATNLVAALRGLADQDLESEIRRLVSSGLFTERGAGERRRLVFKHALVRDAAYESLPAPRRRDLHARCAALLEARLPELCDRRPDLVAEHWHEAELPALAAPYFRRAGERAKSLYARHEAAVFFRRAVEGVEGHDDRGEEISDEAARARLSSCESLGDLMILQRNLDEAGELLERAAELATDPVERARMLRKKAHALETHSRSAEATRELERAEAELGGSPGETSSAAHWREWISVQLVRLMAYHRGGDLESMLGLLAELEPVAEERAERAQRIQLLEIGIASDLRRRRCRPRPSTVADARRLVDLATATGDRGRAADARSTLGLVLLLAGELEPAVEVLTATVESAKKLGDASVEMVAVAFLALARRRQGRDEPCRAASRRLLAGEASPQYHGLAHANLCWWHVRRDEGDLARDHGERALACWQRVPYPFQWTGRLPLASLYLRDDQPERAVAVLRPLTEASQEKLEDPVESAIRAAADAARAGDPGLLRSCLEDVLRSARWSHYH